MQVFETVYDKRSKTVDTSFADSVIDTCGHIFEHVIECNQNQHHKNSCKQRSRVESHRECPDCRSKKHRRDIGSEADEEGKWVVDGDSTLDGDQSIQSEARGLTQVSIRGGHTWQEKFARRVVPSGTILGKPPPKMPTPGGWREKMILATVPPRVKDRYLGGRSSTDGASVTSEDRSSREREKVFFKDKHAHHVRKTRSISPLPSLGGDNGSGGGGEYGGGQNVAPLVHMPSGQVDHPSEREPRAGPAFVPDPQPTIPQHDSGNPLLDAERANGQFDDILQRRAAQEGGSSESKDQGPKDEIPNEPVIMPPSPPFQGGSIYRQPKATQHAAGPLRSEFVSATQSVSQWPGSTDDKNHSKSQRLQRVNSDFRMSGGRSPYSPSTEIPTNGSKAWEQHHRHSPWSEPEDIYAEGPTNKKKSKGKRVGFIEPPSPRVEDPPGNVTPGFPPISPGNDADGEDALNSTGKQAQNLVIAGIAREAVASQTTEEILTVAMMRPRTVLEAAMLTTTMLWTETRRILQTYGRNRQVGFSAR